MGGTTEYDGRVVVVIVVELRDGGGRTLSPHCPYCGRQPAPQ